jgi:hypothetical protein
MNRLILFFAVIASISFSCTKESVTPDDGFLKKDTLQTSISDLKFKLNPVDFDKFTFSVIRDDKKEFKLLLKKDNLELGSYSLSTDAKNSSIVSTTVKYNFQANTSYQILVQSVEENSDTVFIKNFRINEYTHTYTNRLKYEKLASITQLLNFDISPSQNFVYYLDYIDNKPLLKRLSLSEKKIDVLDDNFFSLWVRSVSDDQLVVGSRNYNNHFLKSDSCALLNYNVNTRKTTFLDWGSADYGRFSRVVKNTIAVSNPIETGTISVIDLSDNSKKKFSADLRYLSEYSYDQIYLGDELYDSASRSFISQLPFLSSNDGIAYFDQDSQYFITVEYFRESEILGTPAYSRMIIYKDNKVVYEQPFEMGRSLSFPRIINLKDDKLVFRQYFDYDSKVHIDGYYVLDIKSKQIKLLQNESSIYFNFDFFSGSNKNSFISIRPYEIYKITIE